MKGAAREIKPSFEIHQAREGDTDGILSCLAAAFEPYREAYSAAGFADTVLTRATLASRMRNMTVLVAVADGVVVGTIGWSVHGNEGHLRGMAVLPSWQGTPVAAELLKAAERGIRNHNGSRVTLDTTAPLERATRFYVRNGYTPSGRVTDFFGMPLYEYFKPL